jgi:ankyrin repeat protein
VIHESQLIQRNYSGTDAPDDHVAVWCKTGVLPKGASAECNIISRSQALLSTFDMISSPMPICGVEKSTLEYYLMFRHVFVLSTSKQLPPNSKALKSLLPLLKSSLSQAFLKELVSGDKIAGQDFVETLLHSAICAKDSSIVGQLLRLGCDPDRQVLDHKVPKSLLRLAAEMGELSVVERLVDAGANLNEIPSPLIGAVNGGFLDVVEYLVRCGSHDNCLVHVQQHCSAVAVAAGRGNLEMTRLLLTAFAHVEYRQQCLDEALRRLTMSFHIRSDQDGRNEILKMLLAGGADPKCIVDTEKVARSNSHVWSDDDSEFDSDNDSDESCDTRSWTALEYSAKCGHLDFVATLLENGAQISENAILAAIRSRHAKLACFLLGKMECGSLSHPHGYRMLRDAINHKDAERNTDLVRALLKAGAKPNKFLGQDWGDKSDRQSDEEFYCDSVLADLLNVKYESSEKSPLEIAAEHGHAGLLDLLLSAGAWLIPPEHPHYKFPIEGLTVLDRGAKSGKIEIVERLIEAGADIPSSKEALVHVIEKLQNPEMVWRLIQGGADVNGSAVKQGGTIATPLQAAVRIRNLAITQMLLDAGAKQNPVKPDANTSLLCGALCDAIKAQDHDLINVLLQSGADVNNPPGEEDNDTALEAAVTMEDLNLVFKLLQLGSDPDDSGALSAAAMPNRPAAFLEALLSWPMSAPRSTHYGCAALQIAIRTQDYAKVQRLLQAGVRCDLPAPESESSFQTKRGDRFEISTDLSALGFALKCDQGQCGPILRITFAAGTDPNALVDYRFQRNGLQLAAAENRCDLAQFMIAGGADVNFNCPKCYPKTSCGHAYEPPIRIAVARGNIEIVKLLLSYNARVNTGDTIGCPLLPLAALLGNIALVQTLLDAGAAVNTNGSDFMCPALEEAATQDSTEILRRLLQAGANASGKGSRRDSSVLCYAAYRGYLDTVRILLEAGAAANISANDEFIDPFHLDDDDETSRENMSAIHFCAVGGSVHVAALLVRWGADVNTRARIGKCCGLRKLQRMRRQGKWLAPLSPLEEAAARGHLDMLQLLLDSGARTHGDGARQYRRALGYARRTCNPAAVRLLKKHHAAEGDVRQSDGFGGVTGLQGESEVFPWVWEMNSDRF